MAGERVDADLGGPEFGVVFENPGTFVVELRVRGEGDPEWSEERVELEVERPRYRAECWLDPDAAKSGSGRSERDPVDSWDAALERIGAEWVDGATHEFAIHCRRGTSIVADSGWISRRSQRQGRLVVDAYGIGAKPKIHCLNGPLFYFGDGNGFALVDLAIIGDPGSGSALVRKTVAEPVAGAGGWDGIVMRCDFERGAGGFYLKVEHPIDADGYDAGFVDHFAIVDCSLEQTAGPLLLMDGGRYVLEKDNRWGTWEKGFGVRHKTAQHLDARGNHHPYRPDSGSIFRIHSSTAGVETRWIDISESIFDGEDIWIGPDDGNGVHAPMRHVWFHRNVVDAPDQPRAIAVFAHERLVVRNNWARCNGTAITHRVDPGTTAAVNWSIEGNSLVYTGQAAGQIGVGICIPARVSDLTVRNNLLDAPAMTGAAYFMQVGAGPSSEILTVCDGNQFSSASGRRKWTLGFDEDGATLDRWRQATGHDGSSRDDAVARFVEPAAKPLDLHIQSGSTAIASAVRASGLGFDFDGRSRTQPTDVGAHHRGRSSR